MRTGDEEEEGVDPASSLPAELLQAVFSRLGGKDLARCSSVSRRWRELANDDALWRPLCWANGWRTTDMVDDYRSHRRAPPPPDYPLPPVCKWRLNFVRQVTLPLNWERGDCLSYQLTLGRETEVSCLHSDSDRLAVGHAGGGVHVYDVRRMPCHLASLHTGGSPVDAVRVSGDHLVLARGSLLELWKFADEEYHLVMSETFQERAVEAGGGGGGRGRRGRESEEEEAAAGAAGEGRRGRESEEEEEAAGAAGAARVQRPPQLLVDLEGHVLAAAALDSSTLFVLDLRTGAVRRQEILGVGAKMRFLVASGESVYTVDGHRGASRVACLKAGRPGWAFQVGTPGRTTTALLRPQDGLLLGLGVAGPGSLHKGFIDVWNSENGTLLGSKPTSQVVMRSGAALVCGLVASLETPTSVELWDLKSREVLRRISLAPETPVLVRPSAFPRLLLLSSPTTLSLWDWTTAALCRRLPFSDGRPDPPDVTRLFWADSTMIFLPGSTRSSVQMTSFC